jgi:hypothetical protein
MKALRLLLVTAVFLVVWVGPLFADDLNPPPWQRYRPRTTFQQWEFPTPVANPVPDLLFNPYGTPATSITPGPGMGWLGGWEGRLGVWQLSGEILTTINNAPGGEHKDIWIQLTWIPQIPGQSPNIKEMMTGVSGSTVTTTPLANGWMHTTYKIAMHPNPLSEQIRIWGEINVDELVIDSQCVPEPSSMLTLSGGLLGLLGLACRRRSSW